MLKSVYRNIVLLFFIFIINTPAQYSDNQFGLSLSWNYTTTARLFLNPNAIQKVIREENIEIEDIYSGAVELRYRLSESVMVGIGTEYIDKKSKFRNIVGSPPQLSGIEVSEGFKLIPIEISGYYFIPFSTESLKFYMGGGLGVYFGTYIRNFLDVGLETVDRQFSWGIHGRLGMDYMVTRFFSVRGEMKFRDPEFEITSKYNKERFIYQNNAISLPQEPFTTKVNIDGVTFAINAVLHF